MMNESMLQYENHFANNDFHLQKLNELKFSESSFFTLGAFGDHRKLTIDDILPISNEKLLINLITEDQKSLFDILQPIEQYKRLTKNLAQKYGLNEKFIPKEQDYKRISKYFWIPEIPEIKNQKWIPKYVIIGLNLIIRRKKIPPWILLDKIVDSLSLISEMLRILFHENKFNELQENIIMLSGHINKNYVFEEHLDVIDEIFKK